jgi:hypothetical protein
VVVEGGEWEARELEQARQGTASVLIVGQLFLTRQVLPVMTLSVPTVAQV